MATITITKPTLHGAPESLRHTSVEVDSTGTAFVKNDIVTIGAAGADKLTAGGASATAMAFANEPSSDSYIEPIVGTAQGKSTTAKTVVRLGETVELELNVDATLSQANIGTSYDLVTGNGTMVVDLGSTANAAFKILRVADPLFGGVLGDNQPRVVGVVLDSAAF